MDKNRKKKKNLPEVAGAEIFQTRKINKLF